MTTGSTGATGTAGEAGTDVGDAAAAGSDGPDRDARGDGRVVAALAVAGAIAVLLSNVGGIASGDDGVGYRAIADSLLAGDGLGYFLERPLTVWPPLWPALMAGISAVTPLSTTGAAVVLNAVATVLAVVLGHRLLVRSVGTGAGPVWSRRLVLAGTTVIALGSSTIGFGHLLMTDFAFSVVIMGWLLALMNFRASGRIAWLVGAAALVWLGFGLRYVAVVLIGTGGLWLLLDGRRRFGHRLRDGVLYGAVGVVVPVLWMVRNHAEDGTLLGPRWPSARGPVDNAFDILATLGRFLLPGVANGFVRIWAVVGLVVLVAAALLALQVLRARAAAEPGGPGAPARLVAALGGQAGLLLLAAGLYLVYMLYIRSTTALNQLDLRLLYPAYLPLLVLGIVLVARTAELPPAGDSPWWRRARAATLGWAGVNVAAGLVAVALFAAGNPFFPGNFESDTFDAVRADPALDALPDGCRVVSNLPNALYPTLEPQWSPRRTGLESNQRERDLAELERSIPSTPTCLVWVEVGPVWGHLWTREQLERRVDLVPLAEGDDVTVYRIEPAR